MYYSEGAWINLLIGEYEVGHVLKNQGGLTASKKTSVLSMPHIKCTATVEKKLYNSVIFKSPVAQQ
jgi:hypothetical protein